MKSSTRILAAVALAVPGAIAGFVLGLLAINFVPDQPCVTTKTATGVSTICESSIGLFGLDGYEATGVIGLAIGAIAVPAGFLAFTSKRS